MSAMIPISFVWDVFPNCNDLMKKCSSSRCVGCIHISNKISSSVRWTPCVPICRTCSAPSAPSWWFFPSYIFNFYFVLPQVHVFGPEIIESFYYGSTPDQICYQIGEHLMQSHFKCLSCLACWGKKNCGYGVMGVGSKGIISIKLKWHFVLIILTPF